MKKDKLKDHQVLKDLMQSELNVLGRVSHPNILGIYELLHDDKFYFIVSEYLEHGELYDFIC